MSGRAGLIPFRTLYTDPVLVNGTEPSAADLVARARALEQVFHRPERVVLDLAEADGKVAVAFRLTGRQFGPLNTSAGILPPTSRPVSMRVIDILTLTDGRISAISMVADELGAISAIKRSPWCRRQQADLRTPMEISWAARLLQR